MEREKIIDLSDEKLEELQKKVMEAWDYLHDIVDKVGMPGGDMIFFDNPIKTPSLEVHDSIYSIIHLLREEIENRINKKTVKKPHYHYKDNIFCPINKNVYYIIDEEDT